MIPLPWNAGKVIPIKSFQITDESFFRRWAIVDSLSTNHRPILENQFENQPPVYFWTPSWNRFVSDPSKKVFNIRTRKANQIIAFY